MTHPSDGALAGQTSQEDVDTIELELTVEQIQALSRASVARHSGSYPAVPSIEPTIRPEAPPPTQYEAAAIQSGSSGKRRSRTALIVGLALASALLTAVAYMSRMREPPIQTAEHRSAVAPSPIPAQEAPFLPPVDNEEPVRFKNPFDSKEVFEFPPGTSQQEARDAVAEILLQRARERRQ